MWKLLHKIFIKKNHIIIYFTRKIYINLIKIIRKLKLNLSPKIITKLHIDISHQSTNLNKTINKNILLNPVSPRYYLIKENFIENNRIMGTCKPYNRCNN